MSIADEDNDVLFEGHPLDKYLQEIGFIDYETVKRANPKRDHRINGRHHFCTKIMSLWHGVDLRKCISSEWWQTNKLDCTTVRKITDVIMGSKLLSHEDFQLISSLDIRKEKYQGLSWYAVPIGGTLCAVLWSLKSPLVILGVSTLLLHTVMSWITGRYCQNCLLAVESLVRALQGLQATSRKALRHIQENELIARGFMFSVTGSSVDRLENSSLPSLTRRWQTLPGLREGLASALTTAADGLIKTTQALVEWYPLRGQLDKQQFYMAFQETDFFSSLTTIDSDAGIDSGEIKIASLKVLQNYYLLLQSEFLRRLALTFHLELRLESVPVNPDILSELLDKMLALTEQLSTEYKIFSNYGISRITPTEDQRESIKTSKLKYDALFLSVHSTTLHLQNILYRTRAIEEYLESREDLDVSVIDSDMSTEDLQLAFTDILKELDMCKNCCEQGESFLNNLAKRETVTNFLKNEELSPRCPNESMKRISVGKTDLDPEVEDEVFEAVSTAEYFEDSDDSFEITKHSETEKQQQNYSKLMLDELKSILVDKAKEWKEREDRALKNKRIMAGVDTIENVCKETDLMDAANIKTEVSNTWEILLEGGAHQLKPSNSVCKEVQQTNRSIDVEEKFIFTNKKAHSDGPTDEKSENESKNMNGYLLADIHVPGTKLLSPFGPQAVPLSHKLMLKESETFYGTGENSSSEDSGHE